MAENNAKQPKAARGKGKPFQKGQSGNPGGRPKEVGNVRELARQYTEEAITTLASIMRSGDSDRARAEASSKLLDRGWGRPEQAIEHSGTLKFENVSDTELDNAIAGFASEVGISPVASGKETSTRH